MNSQVKRGKFALLAAVGMVLLGAAWAYAEGHGGASGEAADPLSHAKLMDLLWRSTNFIALVIILVKFGSKPIASALESRRLGIVHRFEDLNVRRSEAEQSYRKYEEKLGRIDQDVQAILETARAQAELERQKIIDEATRAAADIKRKAELSVQFELSQAKQTLREEVADQAAQMAESLIRKSFTEADQAKLVSEYLDKVGSR